MPIKAIPIAMPASWRAWSTTDCRWSKSAFDRFLLRKSTGSARTDQILDLFCRRILDPSGPYEGKSARWIPDVVKACRGPVYLTFDCDGLDASLVPALGTPEPGGLGWYDTLNLITALANGPGILGMDISEIAPIKGFVAPQFCIARLIYRILGRVKAGRRVH